MCWSSRGRCRCYETACCVNVELPDQVIVVMMVVVVVVMMMMMMMMMVLVVVVVVVLVVVVMCDVYGRVTLAAAAVQRLL